MSERTEYDDRDDLSLSDFFKGKDLTKFVRIERLEPDDVVSNWKPPTPLGQNGKTNVENREYVPPPVERPTKVPSGAKVQEAVDELAEEETEANTSSDQEVPVVDVSNVLAERKIKNLLKDFPEYAEEFTEFPPTVRYGLLCECIRDEEAESQIRIGGRVVLTFIENFLVKKGYPLQGYADRTIASPDFQKAFHKTALMYKPTIDAATGGLISHPLVTLAGAMATTAFSTMNANAHNIPTPNERNESVPIKQQTAPPAQPVQSSPQAMYDE